VVGRGGVPVEDAASVADCKAACLKRHRCVAINWDPTEDRCWTLDIGYVAGSV